MDASPGFVHQLVHPQGALRDLPLLLIVAHPDDEVLGAGSRLPYLPRAHIVYVTDGAPRDMVDARRLGFASSEDYAQARVREADAALALLGVYPDRVFRFRLRDQEVAYEMTALSEACAELIEEMQPAAILTHAYEGGHPDHDAVALSVHLACRQRREQGAGPPDLIEFAGYHDADGSRRIVTQEFLPAPVPNVSLRLKPDELVRKCGALACFRTQQDMLRMFRADREAFRAAPRYRFLRPPHAWPPFYERFVRGLDGAGWRRLARRTLKSHGITGLL